MANLRFEVVAEAFKKRPVEVDARKVANKIESKREKAVAYHDTVAPKMEEIRYQIDKDVFFSQIQERPERQTLLSFQGVY